MTSGISFLSSLIDLILGVVAFIALMQLFSIKRLLLDLKTLLMQQMEVRKQAVCSRCRNEFFYAETLPDACPRCGYEFRLSKIGAMVIK